MQSENAKNGNDRHQSLNGNSRLLLKRRTSEGYERIFVFVFNCFELDFLFGYGSLLKKMFLYFIQCL